ncbi:serine hydrolase domain-containing protein [Phenylobacterium sp.]|uniref:serine hydrolase domain-containing protein n=1 Tax=Phenylobacterium sp. TaxID=1871053 RepID=UPI0026151A44|nr:serine hydrolase domain-containing protein [Phenylobacterium sp.]
MKQHRVAAVLLGLAFAIGLAPSVGAQDEPSAASAAPPAERTPARPEASPQPATPTAATAPQAAPKPAPAAAGPVTSAPTAPVQPGARLSAGQPIPPAELAAFADGFVRAAMARDHIAGVTVSVVQDGQLVFKRGYGYADLERGRPVDPDRSLFRIGSISKTFTWIALMKAVETGRMRLDQPVNLYLPQSLRIPDQGFDQPIRLANLMDHSPGFEDRALGHLFEDRFDFVRPLATYLRQDRPKRVRPPGAVSSYSNYGAALAGEAVSFVAGKPYETLIEDEILGPAKLGHTTFREPHPLKPGLPSPMPAGLAADVANPYRWTGSGFERRGYEYIEQIAPAGAASSTAADMGRYMLLLLGNGSLEGATIYGPAAAQAFRTPLRVTPPGINGWAHGFAIYALPGGYRGYGHDGGTLSFFSNMVVAPDLKLGLFISTNTDGGGRLAGSFAPAVIRQFYAPPPPPPRPGSAALAQQAQAFAGYYLSTRRAYSGLEGFVTGARAGLNVSVSPDGRLLLADAGGASAWVPEGPSEAGRFIASQDDSRIAFVMREGRATALLPSSGSVLFERTSPWNSPSRLLLVAALAAAAALATLAGLVLRNRREVRESAIQARASLVQNIQAGLWLAAFLLFGLWIGKALSDLAWVMYSWPGALLILASTCALVAAALTLPTLIALPAIWSGGRRVDSWSYLRKAFFTVTVAINLVFSVMLGLHGALSPWSG